MQNMYSHPGLLAYSYQLEWVQLRASIDMNFSFKALYPTGLKTFHGVDLYVIYQYPITDMPWDQSTLRYNYVVYTVIINDFTKCTNMRCVQIIC